MKVVLVVGETYSKGTKTFYKGVPKEAGKDSSYLLSLSDTDGKQRFVKASDYQERVIVTKPDTVEDLVDDIENPEGSDSEESNDSETGETSTDTGEDGENEENEQVDI